MKVKTSDLTGAALDWAVLACLYPQRFETVIGFLSNWNAKAFRYSTEHAQGGPIIDAKFIDTYCMETEDPIWEAEMQKFPKVRARGRGRTRLSAAMRCLVAHELGDEVDIPDELVNGSAI
jgi:Protein of unknown function (DUF2591)